MTSVMLTAVPTCSPGAETGAQLYTDEIQAHCALASYHGTNNAMQFGCASAADVKTHWLGKPSTELPSMNYVTAGNISQSYVIYKLLGEQAAASGYGIRCR